VSKLASVFSTFLTRNWNTLMTSLHANLSRVKLTRQGECNYRLIIPVPISCLHHAERFWDLTFGKLVLRRLSNRLILILLTIVVLLKKRRLRLKTWQIELSMTALTSTRVSWIRLKLNFNTVSVFIREVSFQATLSVLLTLTELILKLAAEPMPITLLKLDGFA